MTDLEELDCILKHPNTISGTVVDLLRRCRPYVAAIEAAQGKLMQGRRISLDRSFYENQPVFCVRTYHGDTFTLAMRNTLAEAMSK